MKVNADLHIHGKYSQGVSNKMEIPVIASESQKKGIDIVGTGDILNPRWMQHVKKETNGEGLRKHDQTYFALTTEVEDENRVHHLLIFPSMSEVEAAYHDFKQISKDIRSEGRPRIQASGTKIAELAEKHGALTGPAHIFTPYTGIYGNHDSLQQCYTNCTDTINFLELGLSADSRMASQISGHNEISLLSNSDAHSPWPHRLGREFNTFKLKQYSFKHLKKSIQKGPAKNIGLDPREGKYHRTACNRCYKQYSLKQAEKQAWKCRECGSRIKKGVKDRVKELKDQKPTSRPEYLHLPPLSNIIQQLEGHSSPTTKTVQRRWRNLYNKLGSEAYILVDADITEIEEVDEEVAIAVNKFRNGKYDFVEGGGGNYGKIII